MKNLASVLVAVIALVQVAAAIDDFPRVPPTEPDRAEATFEVLHGFRMELIAAEPLVASPVDLAYDEDGRAYVVEMRDYPYPEEKNAEPKVFPGTVRLLEDSDGDGRFDKATIFADQLAWPTSACCWKGGVFVAAAPDIWYFKDTDGDRKADVRRKVFTGFGRYNVQAIMNNLRWGLDNKIYGAAAGNGGTIRHAERPDDKPISLSRRDFCFDPLSEKLEAISGGERFGNTFDDWGNRFVCNIRNPVQHVVLEQRYLARNPHFVAPSPIHDCAASGDQLRVFRLSPPEPWRVFRAQRWALEGQAMPRSELIGAGFWTSSSGVTVYRGGAYPPQFRGNVFIGEVAGNLVHRQILERDGVTFKSRRADENTEFIRSRDNWFRPVNFVNAPDGTLHVIDMYRETIEHPWSIPDDIKAKLDLTSGKDRGRIYRLTPPEFSHPKPPKLSAATTTQLVAHLESPHSWYRETAQRLLVERQDESAMEPLNALASYGKTPQVRLHTMYLLDQFAKLSDGQLRRLFRDRHAEVRRNAVKLADERIAKLPHSAAMMRDFQTSLSEAGLAHDSDPAVRFQAALSLSQNDTTGLDFRDIALRDADDPWMRTAILTAPPSMVGSIMTPIVGAAGREPNPKRGVTILVRELAGLIGTEGKPAAVKYTLHLIATHARADHSLAALAGLGQGLARHGEKLSDYLPQIRENDREPLQKQIADTTAVAANTNAVTELRAEAINLLGFMAWSDVKAALLSCLASSERREVQRAALRVLGTFNEPAISGELIGRWKQLAPPFRDDVVGILLSRPIWHEALVAALESGEIPAGQVSIPHRQRLAALADAKLAERAKAALASVALSPRKEIIEKYQAVLALNGEAERGKVVYRRECMNCHKRAGEGHDVGPSLETIQHRSPQEILIHVLDPCREVSPQFLDYSVRLTDGRVLNGMIASESDSGLVLRRADNREDVVMRSEIDDISSSGKSLMPEGLEQKIPLQEMSDLIRFLKLAP